MAVLKVLAGTHTGEVLDLEGDRMVMGRHPNCKIVIDQTAVSRHHAQILQSHGSYYLEDMRSRNGTLLNGQRISGRMELRENDRIKVCGTVFSFHEAPPRDVAPETVDGLRNTTPEVNFAPDAGAELPTTVETRKPGKRQAADKATAHDGGPDENSNPAIVSTLNVTSIKDLRLAERSESKLQAILEISNTLGNVLELDQLLPKILDSLFTLFPRADRGFILLKDRERSKFVMKSLKVREDSEVPSPPISKTIINHALLTREAILSEDAAGDSRFGGGQSSSHLHIHSLLCVPLLDQSGDPLGIIQIDTFNVRHLFTEDDLKLLASVARQAALAVENAYLHEAALKRRDIERDLEFATQVQLGFLPTERPRVSGYEFFDYYEAAHHVGGDLFDYVTLPDGRVAITVGDVAGKGIPAALLMARMYSMARYHLLAEPTAAKALTALNAGIATSGLGHRFITYVIAILDARSHTLTLANAGHLAPILRERSGTIRLVAESEAGYPLGVQPDFVYPQVTLTLQPGDTLLLFTDGVTEAMNPAQEIYGLSRLMQYASAAKGNIDELGEGLIADVEKFSAGRALRDDICVVALRRSRDS